MVKKRESSKQTRDLAKELRPIFWDYNFRRLRWDRDRELIIGRILSHGDWQALKWLRSRVDSAALRNWLLRRRGAGLSSPQLRFWELILELPHRKVNEWLANKGRRVWEKRVGERRPSKRGSKPS